MRAFALGMIFSTTAMPCFAQTALKSEPLILAPYEVALVQSASCPAGKVLKVTGAIRGAGPPQGLRVSRQALQRLPGNEARLTNCAWR
jgi:hypothetical protein